VELIDQLLCRHDGRPGTTDITLTHPGAVIRAGACSPSHRRFHDLPVGMPVVQTGIEHNGRIAGAFALDVQTPAAHIHFGAGAQVLGVV
jgi:hypothetical protein